MKEQKKAIVIGSGIGGLASAIRLAILNFDVTVFEKNNYVGGKNSQLIIGDYKFDAGPSLFTQPELIEDLFKLVQEPIEEYFTYTKQPISCKYLSSEAVSLFVTCLVIFSCLISYSFFTISIFLQYDVQKTDEHLFYDFTFSFVTRI